MNFSTEVKVFFPNYQKTYNKMFKKCFFTLLKRPAPKVFELQGSYWYQMKRNAVLYRSTEKFFFNFRVFKTQKTYDLRKLKMSMKRWSFLKKRKNSKMKMKCEKNSLYFCRSNESSSSDARMDYVGRFVRQVVYSPRTSFSPLYLNILFSMRNRRKSTRRLPYIFSDFTCAHKFSLRSAK